MADHLTSSPRSPKVKNSSGRSLHHLRYRTLPSMNHVPRAALAIIAAAWLVVCGVGPTGCGDLRKNLGPAGGSSGTAVGGMAVASAGGRSGAGGRPGAGGIGGVAGIPGADGGAGASMTDAGTPID